jgi:hypothetical protein
MTGGCVCCGKEIKEGITYSQYCHDRCYIEGLPRESLLCWLQGSLLKPNDRERAEQLVKMTDVERFPNWEKK